MDDTDRAERDPLIFSTTYMTTRRRYELDRINEVDAVLATAFKEIDDCLNIVEGRAVPDGECQITIIVSQRTKPKEQPTTDSNLPTCSHCGGVGHTIGAHF